MPFDGLPSYLISISYFSPIFPAFGKFTINFLSVASNFASLLFTFTLWICKPTESNDTLSKPSRKGETVWVTSPITFFCSRSNRSATLECCKSYSRLRAYGSSARKKNTLHSNNAARPNTCLQTGRIRCAPFDPCIRLSPFSPKLQVLTPTIFLLLVLVALQKTSRCSAIHRQRNSVYITGSLRCQKRNSRPKPLWRSQTPRRNQFLPTCEHFFGARAASRSHHFREFIQPFRARISRADVVHGNSVRAILICQRFHEPGHASPQSVRKQQSLHGLFYGIRSNGQQAAPFILLHARQNSVRKVHRAHQQLLGPQPPIFLRCGRK